MIRATGRVGAGLVAVAFAITACGSSGSGSGSGHNDSSAPPATELASAITALTDGSVLSTTLSLDTTAANLQKISGEGGDTPLTPTQANLISGARLTVEVAAPNGKTLATAKSGNAVSLTGTSGGTTFFALRDVDHTLYLQVDLKDLLTDVGQPSTYRSLAAQGSRLPGFVQALFAGKWVSISHDTISGLEGAVAGVTPGGVPNSSQILTLGSRLRRDLLTDLTVTRTSTGDTDVLALAGNLRAIAKTFLTDIAAGIPASASSLRGVDTSQVPNKTLKATAEVTGGALSKLEFDFGQFSPGQKDTLPVAATFAKDGPAITAPAGAAAVNTGQLFQMLAQFGSSGS